MAASQIRFVWGASRIIHGIGLFEDFRFEDDDIVPGRLSAWVRDRDYPVLVEPFADLENGEVAELADHPLPLMSKLGYRTASSILSTDRLLELTEYLELQIEDLFELTRDAVAVSLLPQPLRVQLWEELVFPFLSSWVKVLLMIPLPTMQKVQQSCALSASMQAMCTRIIMVGLLA
ncbi:hypothetical protein CIP107532_00642 [Corynebacterium diphtheriae]|nr:hypothetical protein CIP107532_00642 [Corynebacterium diphtheriae]